MSNANWWDRAQKVMPGGVNSPVRSFKSVPGEPLFFRSAKGARFTDEDGRSYIDWCLSWGPLILGHADPDVHAAALEAMNEGASFGAPSRREVLLAEAFLERMPHFDQVRFVSSGTEAVMSAIRLARGFTGRDVTVKFTGCYHGHTDSLLVEAGSGLATFGTPSSAGVPKGFTDTTAVLPLDDLEKLEAFFAKRGDEVAAVIIEPVPANSGLLIQRAAFLKALRDLTTKHGALLIFDEVITGFRVGRSGAAPVLGGGVGGGTATATCLELPNDEVFVFAGGTPPFPLLEAAGVSFDPELRPQELPDADRGTGLLIALSATLFGLVVLLLVRMVNADYYGLHPALRPGSPQHDLLRPQGTVGLSAGLAAVALLLVNLAYLLRRAPAIGRRLPGSLKNWMSLHVATGLAACLLAMLHSGYHLRRGAGGHALLAMVIVVVAGVVGRWFYAFVPRAQNGRQQDLDELQTQVAAIASEWDEHGRGFGSRVRQRVDELAERAQLGRSLVARIGGLLHGQWRLRRELDRLRQEGRAEGIPLTEVRHVLSLAERSYRLALQLVHFEEVRGLMSTWRYIHRWLALLLTLLVIVHVVAAVRYGGIDLSVLPFLGGSR